MAGRHILDNQTEASTVASYLKQALAHADELSIVSAYFTIHGYDILANHLEKVGRTRFLFGDPGSVETLDPGRKQPKVFVLSETGLEPRVLTEAGLEPRLTLTQKGLARRCADWVKQAAVEIRSIRRANMLHGKMYLTTTATAAWLWGRSAVVGSSNFTRQGLGGGQQPNLEINLASEEPDTVQELQTWFDELWGDQDRTKDVKQQVLAALERIGDDYAPAVVYYKTLYEIFRQEIDARQARDEDAAATGFKDSQVWNALYQFQKDGAKSVIDKLGQHNGCILADSVGLGKTYTALAVIKYFELCSKNQGDKGVLVLCPRKLYQNWALYPAYNGNKHNPFSDDCFAYTLLAHTDLSRTTGESGSVDLENFGWGDYGLVVIDESHNFRNDGSSRYQRLLEEVIQAGASTKVLMLSATPVNTSLIDLRNQIYLMSEGRESAFRHSLGVGNIRALMGRAQKAFKAWEEEQRQQQELGKTRDKVKLLDNLGVDFLRLLDGVSISRSRRQIEQFYAEEMGRIGPFPQRAKPESVFPRTDLEGELCYHALAEAIGTLKLAVYQPSAYVVDQQRLAELERRRQAQNFNQKDSERFLVGMMRVNLLKRLESSAHALELTMERTIEKVEALLKKIEKHERGPSQTDELSNKETSPDDDDEDEEFLVNRARNPYHLSELDLPRWRDHLLEDKAMLEGIWRQVKDIKPERDGKLKELKQHICRKVNQPSHNRDGQPNRKLLVFTTFKDTARYLYDNLKKLCQELDITMAMVSGDETHATGGSTKFDSVLADFAPIARKRREDTGRTIDLLIATDCISEGQNLQDCDTVLNYDIHWNPVRLVQRFGRIDRIGSRNPTVYMVNYWPTEDMEAYLRLQLRVQARMAIADLAASGDEDPFSEADMEQGLRFRDEQLRRLREEIPDLEELSDGPMLADFSLDDFFTQLLRYLEHNKAKLEAMPCGAYAVTHSNDQPSVIFCLRQRNASSDNDHRPASPVHPHYLVCIQEDGRIRYGCGSARTILTAFKAAAAGQSEPLKALCRRFDQQTDNGRQMGHYENLLEHCIAQIRAAHNHSQMTGLSCSGDTGFKLPRASEAPRNAVDFELLTWLVIKEEA